jgi:hypothetical protein
MLVPCQKRSTYLHTARCDPHIVNRYLSPTFLKRQVDYGVFPRNIGSYIDDFNVQTIDDLPQFSFIELLPLAVHEAKSQLANDNGWHIDVFPMSRYHIDGLADPFRIVTINVRVED